MSKQLTEDQVDAIISEVWQSEIDQMIQGMPILTPTENAE